MKKFILTVACSIIALTLVSCSTTVPFAATSNPVGNKMGKSQIAYILIFPISNDAGIYKAAKNGGISKISTVDVKYTNILGFYRSMDTIVSGE